MPNRMIKEGINESHGLTNCSIFAQDLYKRLITYADDYGRFNADVQIMLARLYPLELSVVTTDDLMEGLIELAGVNKIGFYTGHDQEHVYGAFPNWGDHQRLRDSKKKNPDPADNSVNDWYLQRFVPLKMKIAIIERDGFKCRICGKHIAEIDDAKKLVKMGAGLFHIDHIVPVGQGGRATLENLQLTCPKCNLSRKRTYTFEEIVEFSKSCRNSQIVAETCGELRRTAARNQEKGKETKTKTNNAGAGAREDHETFISPEESFKIQRDHQTIMNKMEYVGFEMNSAVVDSVIDLYAVHGLDAVLKALDECVGVKGNKLRYLRKVIENLGKQRSQNQEHGYEIDERGDAMMTLEETEALWKTVV